MGASVGVSGIVTDIGRLVGDFYAAYTRSPQKNIIRWNQLDEGAEVLEQHTLSREKGGEGASRKDRGEVAVKEHPVESGDLADDVLVE